MKATFDKGKHFTKAELRPLAEANRYRLVVETSDKQSLIFEGELQERKLTLERIDEKAKETQRLTIRLLHSNRIVYQFDVKPEGKTLFVKKYQVGATKEGEAFAAGSSGPECVVSGGRRKVHLSNKWRTSDNCGDG